jgi:hypothetical protein
MSLPDSHDDVVSKPLHTLSGCISGADISDARNYAPEPVSILPPTAASSLVADLHASLAR